MDEPEAAVLIQQPVSVKLEVSVEAARIPTFWRISLAASIEAERQPSSQVPGSPKQVKSEKLSQARGTRGDKTFWVGTQDGKSEQRKCEFLLIRKKVQELNALVAQAAPWTLATPPLTPLPQSVIKQMLPVSAVIDNGP